MCIESIINNYLSQSGDLLNLFGMVGMSGLTILIPIAIAMFNDTKDFEVLDKNVILNHVIKAQHFIWYIVLIFFPLLIWSILPSGLKLIGLVVWGVGVYYVFAVLVNSYYWIKGRKFDARFAYLRNLRDPEDMEESWRSVWETPKINTPNEKEFFQIFSEVIDDLMKKDGK